MPDLLNKVEAIQGLPHDIVSNNKYIVRFAHTTDDLEAAQRLRFQVFNIELGEGLDTSFEYQRDIDPYDNQCHHLLVIERSSEKIIGTYRMQTYRIAQTEKGFYTEQEFEVNTLPSEVLKKSVEVGRACIEREHRNGRVLYLLWRGLAKYISHTNSRYLFGCCSLTSQDETEAWQVMDFLEKRGEVHPDFRAETKSPYKCSLEGVDPASWKNVKLPQLFRLYMDLGARVCSPPAIDKEFKTIDYLVILDIEDLDERTRMLFFK